MLGADYVARFDPPGLLFFDFDGVRVLFETGGQVSGNSILYLWTDDLDASVARLEPVAREEPFGGQHAVGIEVVVALLKNDRSRRIKQAVSAPNAPVNVWASSKTR